MSLTASFHVLQNSTSLLQDKSDRIALPATQTYDERNGSYASKLESDISPHAIFLPETTDEVSKFVKLLGPIVQEGAVKFAIRDAGCQPLPGCANIQGGVTLDLSRLVGTTPDESQGTVRIPAGELWGAVYKAVQYKGLGVTGARSGNNGIGGLASSANHISKVASRSSAHAKASSPDNIVNYEVVLASGEVVNANRHENADLFVALRGGGNNLGIVTRFDLSAFPQGNFWGGALFYFPDSFGGQIDALVTELHRSDVSEETHVMISLFYADQFSKAVGVDGAMGLSQAYYTQEVEKPAVLEPFTNTQPQIDALNSMRMTDLVSAAEEQAKQAMTSVRCAYMNTTVKVDAPTLHAATEIFKPALEKVKSIDGMVFSFTMQPYPVSLLKRTAPAGGNVLGLKPADGPLVSILILLYWNKQSDDEVVLSTARSVIEAIDKDATARGTLVRYKYLNYAFDFQDPIGSYGQENRKKLQDASRKYDPDGLFQKGVPGGFKLFP
ncbi:hypothetical protein PG994_007209 [Apiospora phragmitis]|uniref:FAD-binding PCMH-type domain-containing protein n=1 Tax=Apiospora phragmitis TaxID=2905665 RepID=A0ABR1V078_9PEZI